MSIILSKALSHQTKILGHIVDYRSQAGQTGTNHLLVVTVEDELDTGLLQLGQEDLAGVLDQRHNQLKGLGHVGNNCIVTLNITR